jgi:hypothetical protein
MLNETFYNNSLQIVGDAIVAVVIVLAVISDVFI